MPGLPGAVADLAGSAGLPAADRAVADLQPLLRDYRGDLDHGVSRPRDRGDPLIPIIPPIYLPPTNGPLYWADEASGVLRSAVWAFFHRQEDARQLRVIIEYVQYWVNAPCWAGPGLQGLREAAATMRTRADVEGVVRRGLRLGIDPF
jgi:hypothetical protein